MAKIVIDGRESGTTTGRYIDKLVEYLHKEDPKHDIIVLTKPSRVEYMESKAPAFHIISTRFQEFGFGEQLGFLRQIRNLKPDLVHFGMVQQPILYRGRVVTTMHDLTTCRFTNPLRNPVTFRIKQFVYANVNKVAARKSAVIITPSTYVKNDVVQFTKIAPERVVVTYEAADKIADEPEPVAALKQKEFIFYVGRPQPHKNLARLIDAFAILQETHPNIVLALVGAADPLYEQFANIVRKRNLTNVIFTGFVSEGQLRWLYENTAAYTFPSLSEGFGLPGLEAMIHGAPVVASNATCLPEIYKDAAHYFDPLLPADIAQKIAKVIDNPRLAQTLRNRGQEVARSYSWQKMARETLAVYEKALTN